MLLNKQDRPEMRKTLLIVVFALGVGVNCLASTNPAEKETEEPLLKLSSAAPAAFTGEK